jgi:hypothetical protein
MKQSKSELLESYLSYVQTYEQTIVISEYQMQEYLLEMKDLSKKTEEFMKWGEKKLKDVYNISVDPIRKLGKKQGELLRKEFDKGTTPEQLGKKIASSVKNFIIEQGKKAVKSFKETEFKKKILVGILVLCIIFYTNSLLVYLLSLVLSPSMVTPIVAIVLAPLVEEAAKTFFIKKDMPWVGTLVVFGLEAVQYIFMLILSGATITGTLILRLATILMHFSTTYVQKKIIDKHEIGDKKAEYIAWATGVGIHAAWNAVAIVFNTKIMSFISK